MEESDREPVLISARLPQMPAEAKAGTSHSGKPGTQSMSLIGVAGIPII